MFKSWKTTLLGFGVGALNLIANGVNWESALLSSGFAAFGLVAKDYNATGGTTPR